MPTTPNLGLPYPAGSDAPDLPGAIYALATKLDADQTAWAGFVPEVQNANTGANGYKAARSRRLGRKTIAVEYEVFLNGPGCGVTDNVIFKLPTQSLSGLGTAAYWPSGVVSVTGTDGITKIGVPVIGTGWTNNDPTFFIGMPHTGNGPFRGDSAAWGSGARIHAALTYAEQ